MSSPVESATQQAVPGPTREAAGRVFSGVQPSGLPHLGNYLGAFRNYIAMQDGHDAIYGPGQSIPGPYFVIPTT